MLEDPAVLPRLCLFLCVICATSAPAAEEPPREQQIRAAIAKSLPLLVAGARGALAHSRQCFMCHNQALPAMALVAARSRGFPVDDELLHEQSRHIARFLDRNRDRYREGKGQGGQVDMAGYALWALELDHWKPDETTSAVTTYLLQYHSDRDHWDSISDRPPSEKSPFTATYVALRGLSAYGTTDQRVAIEERQQKVRDWLVKTPAVDTEDRVFRLWALQAVNASEDDVAQAASALLATQSAEGAWAQSSDREVDAYATGSALVALHETGRLKVTDDAWNRGIDWLMQAQKEDGSWHVVTHAKPIQSYFESGYPHGEDQFISIAAAGWATTALALSLPPSVPPAPTPTPTAESKP